MPGANLAASQSVRSRRGVSGHLSFAFLDGWGDVGVCLHATQEQTGGGYRQREDTLADFAVALFNNIRYPTGRYRVPWDVVKRSIMHIRELTRDMGRHREFNEDVALEAALAVFWERGYEGTSFDDLSRATKVARPGLYAAFGNKESLFLKALDFYDAKYTLFMREALEKPSSLDVVTHILRKTVELNTRFTEHLGCLGVNGAVACSSEAESIRLELVRRRSLSEAALARRLKRAQKESDLTNAVEAGTMARLVMTLTQGISVQAKAGVGKGILMKMVDEFLRTWPSKPATSIRSKRFVGSPVPGTKVARSRAKAS